jgi:hypothetical protein
MKVLSLQCAGQHGFEGWFGSEADFQSQLARGLVACPLCGNTVVHKLPSAPRLNLLGSVSGPSASPRVRDPHLAPQGGEKGHANELVPGPLEASSNPAQVAFLSAVRQLLQNTEDVGSRFAEEARRIHYGEIESRNIRGQTSPREAVELIEEGIEVIPLPLPVGMKHTLQ